MPEIRSNTLHGSSVHAPIPELRREPQDPIKLDLERLGSNWGAAPFKSTRQGLLATDAVFLAPEIGRKIELAEIPKAVPVAAPANPFGVTQDNAAQVIKQIAETMKAIRLSDSDALSIAKGMGLQAAAQRAMLKVVESQNGVTYGRPKVLAVIQDGQQVFDKAAQVLRRLGEIEPEVATRQREFGFSDAEAGRRRAFALTQQVEEVRQSIGLMEDLGLPPMIRVDGVEPDNYERKKALLTGYLQGVQASVSHPGDGTVLTAWDVREAAISGRPLKELNAGRHDAHTPELREATLAMRAKLERDSAIAPEYVSSLVQVYQHEVDALAQQFAVALHPAGALLGKGIQMAALRSTANIEARRLAAVLEDPDAIPSVGEQPHGPHHVAVEALDEVKAYADAGLSVVAPQGESDFQEGKVKLLAAFKALPDSFAQVLFPQKLDPDSLAEIANAKLNLMEQRAALLVNEVLPKEAGFPGGTPTIAIRGEGRSILFVESGLTESGEVPVRIARLDDHGNPVRLRHEGASAWKLQEAPIPDDARSFIAMLRTTHNPVHAMAMAASKRMTVVDLGTGVSLDRKAHISNRG